MNVARDEEHGTRARRALIRQLLVDRRVATQRALRALLVRSGHRVTQGTLSRDLAALGARRAPLPGGGMAYELPAGPGAPPAAEELRTVGALVTRVRDNASLVVVNARAGAASAVALALDTARLPEVLGSIAGDDTVFVAPAQGTSAARLRQRLEEFFFKREKRE
jgi:transcriptional regulator of arginine metabolism